MPGFPAAFAFSAVFLACAAEAPAPPSSPATTTVEIAQAAAELTSTRVVSTTTPSADPSSPPPASPPTSGLRATVAMKLEGDLAPDAVVQAINTQLTELKKCVAVIRATDGVVGSLNLQVTIAKDGKVVTELQSPVNDNAKRCVLDGARGWVVKGAGSGKAMLLLNLE